MMEGKRGGVGGGGRETRNQAPPAWKTSTPHMENKQSRMEHMDPRLEKKHSPHGKQALTAWKTWTQAPSARETRLQALPACNIKPTSAVSCERVAQH